MKLINALLIITSNVAIASCRNDLKFDKNKWMEKEDMEYTYRNDMVNDLVKNHKLTGLKYSEVTNLLGPPQHIKNNEFYYQIVIKYDVIDPSYIKKLLFHMSPDSLITSSEIVEIK